MEIIVDEKGNKYLLASKEYVKAVYDRFNSTRKSSKLPQILLFQILIEYYEQGHHFKNGISTKNVGKELKKRNPSKKSIDFQSTDGEYGKTMIDRLDKALYKFFENSQEDDILRIISRPLYELNPRVRKKNINTWIFIVESLPKYPVSPIQNQVDKILFEKTTLFVGRKEEWQILDDFINENQSGYVLVTAGAGMGKTSFLANWLSAKKDKKYYTAYHFFNSQHPNINSTTQCYRSLLSQLCQYYPLDDQYLHQDEDTIRDTIYNTITENKLKHKRPLIIVIDALDEADRHFLPPFPTPLPQGVFVIVSARIHENEQPEYLRGWTDPSLKLNLKGLGRSAISDWLRQTAKGNIAYLADDINFITRLRQATEGFPLFLDFLIDEIINTSPSKDEVNALLNRTPKGFSSYILDQINRIAKDERVRSHKDLQRLFAILAVARGPISQDDIQQLTDLTVFDLQALPWQVARWFNVNTVQSNKIFYSFTHQQLAKEFEKALGHQADKALDTLMSYCSRWDEHYSTYALQKYAQHLYEQKQFDKLFQLARSDRFTKAQQKHLVEYPLQS